MLILMLLLQEPICVSVTSSPVLLFGVRWLTAFLKSSAVTSYNDLFATAAANTSCNLFDCLVPIVTLGCVALNLEARNDAGATGCVIGGAQAVCSRSTLLSVIGTDRSRSVHVSIVSLLR